MKIWGILVVAIAPLACRDVVCAAIPTPAIAADITDSVSGAPAAYHASLIVSGTSLYDSTYASPPYPNVADTLSLRYVTSSVSVSSGTYDVRVRKTGYRLWSQNAVAVGGGACGPFPAKSVTVRLQPDH